MDHLLNAKELLGGGGLLLIQVLELALHLSLRCFLVSDTLSVLRTCRLGIAHESSVIRLCCFLCILGIFGIHLHVSHNHVHHSHDATALLTTPVFSACRRWSLWRCNFIFVLALD